MAITATETINLSSHSLVVVGFDYSITFEREKKMHGEKKKPSRRQCPWCGSQLQLHRRKLFHFDDTAYRGKVAHVNRNKKEREILSTGPQPAARMQSTHSLYTPNRVPGHLLFPFASLAITQSIQVSNLFVPCDEMETVCVQQMLQMYQFVTRDTVFCVSVLTNAKPTDWGTAH